MKILYLYLLIFLFISPMPFFSGQTISAASKKDELEAVKKEIEKKRKRVNEAKRQETKVTRTLDTIDKELTKKNQEFQAINRNISRLQKEIDQVHKKAENLEKELKKKEDILNKRLFSAYRFYRRGSIQIIIESVSYNDFLRKDRFLRQVLDKDHALFSQCLDAFEKQRDLEQELEIKQKELLNSQQKLADQRKSVQKTRSEKMAHLQKVRSEKTFQMKALEELEKRSRELQTFMEKLHKKKRAFTPAEGRFSEMRGKLSFPVEGKVITTFGKKEHPELNTFTFQKGIEIEADYRKEIKAIFDGRVVFADWFKGYGNMIIIDHGEHYYSISAYACELLKQVDDIIMQGEPIALVGDAGSMKGNCLYFEIRHRGKPQNPMAWIR